MRTLIAAFIWAVVNLAGLWIAWLGLFHVGRLGIAALGMVIVTAAWLWLAFMVIASLKDRMGEPNLPARIRTGS